MRWYACHPIQGIKANPTAQNLRENSPPYTAASAPEASGCSTLFPETVGIQLAERVLPANEVVDEDASPVASRTVGMVSLR